MNKVKKVRLEDITINLDKFRIPLSSSVRSKLDKRYPYYGAQSIVDYVDRFLFDGEYLLVAEDGENLKSQNSNVCNYVTGKFWVNNHAHILQANGDNSLKYIYYLLNLRDFRPYVTGSAQPKLTQDNLNKMELLIHEPCEQHKIASMLSSLDSKIELNNRINGELEAMAKTLYDYWFVQFDFPDKKGKPYKTSGGKLVWNEELKREIPEGWEVEPLFIAMDVQYGFPFSTSQFTDEVTDIPVIRIRDILENTISTYTTEKVDDKYRLQQNDLLIGMDGNFHLNFWDKDGAYLNQRSVRIRSRHESEVSNLQAYFELSPYIKARERNVSRTTVGHLSDKDLKRLFLILPPKTVSFKPKEMFNSILSEITSNRLQNQQLSDLRNWLLPMLMNGQVKVVDILKLV